MVASHLPKKANRVLHFILLAFLLILMRIWYLCMVEHETYLELSKKPQKKVSLEKPLRGTIRDRFNIPLAVNKLQYDAAICYDQIRQIPSVKRLKDPQGNLTKHYLRKEYIGKLSCFLAQTLHLDPLDIEDIIYGKASLFPSTPFTLKENISEETYYYLKGLERSYPGLCSLKNIKRCYPQQKTGADLVGYIGSINETEYFTLAHEIKELQHYLLQHEQGHLIFLPKGFSSIQDIKKRLQLLKTKMYQFNDQLGKAGIEASFDDLLRGAYGKKSFEVNTKGSIVRELPGTKSSIPGHRLLLNISAELQEFAESLLAENEAIRDKKFSQSGKDHHLISSPWIKGGAIVAMIPTTGEIVAMASYPRINGNDFVAKTPSSSAQVSRFLENGSYIRDLWDGKTSLERELYSFVNNHFYSEEKKLTLDHYLDMILSLQGSTRKSFQKISSLSAAIELQKASLLLLDLSEQPYMHALIDALYAKDPHAHLTSFSTNKEQIETINHALIQHELLVKDTRLILDKVFLDVPYNDDKLLILDLARLIAPSSHFSDLLLDHVGEESLKTYRSLTQAAHLLLDDLKTCAKEYFHLHDFREWRTSHFKDYLQKKRLEEKEKKTYQKPYIDYLKHIEQEQFKTFWKETKWHLLTVFLTHSSNDDVLSSYLKCHKDTLKAHPDSHHHLLDALHLLEQRLSHLEGSLHLPYLKTMRSYQDLSEKLYGYYPQIKKRKASQTEKDLAAAFYPSQGYGYGRSYAFRQSTPLGSIFKIITTYEALKQNYERGVYEHTHDLNPLTIIDDIQPSSKLSGDMVLGYHEDGTKITRRYKVR
jgi:cell division protein FtsI/penicillin-binding protein 2